MKANEFRNLTTAEIEQKIAGFKEELFNLRFQLATGQLDNPHPIKKYVKKSLVRKRFCVKENSESAN